MRQDRRAGFSGGTAGVLQQRHVFGRGRQGRAGRQRGDEGGKILRRGGHLVRCPGKGDGILAQHQLEGGLRPDQCQGMVAVGLGRKRDQQAGTAVGEFVCQGWQPVQRAQMGHGGPGGPGAEQPGRVPGAIRQIESHDIAAPDPARSQGARYGCDALRHVAIGRDRAVILQQRPGGMVADGLFQEYRQRRGRRGEIRGSACRQESAPRIAGVGIHQRLLRSRARPSARAARVRVRLSALPRSKDFWVCFSTCAHSSSLALPCLAGDPRSSG